MNKWKSTPETATGEKPLCHKQQKRNSPFRMRKEIFIGVCLELSKKLMASPAAKEEWLPNQGKGRDFPLIKVHALAGHPIPVPRCPVPTAPHCPIGNCSWIPRQGHNTSTAPSLGCAYLSTHKVHIPWESSMRLRHAAWILCGSSVFKQAL